MAAKMRRLRKLPDEVMQRLPESAANIARDLLESDAAARPSSNPEKGGRQQTGYMAEHLTHWVTSEGDDHKWVAIGWRPQDFSGFRTPDYPVIQDTGDPAQGGAVYAGEPGGERAGSFEHVPDANYIPAVGALDVAAYWLREQIVAEMRRKANEI